jgi:hypothetical protein
MLDHPDLREGADAMIRNPPGRDEYIWLDEAVTEYDHPRQWYEERIVAGKLHAIQQPGDPRVYLLRHEIERQTAWTDANEVESLTELQSDQPPHE